MTEDSLYGMYRSARNEGKDGQDVLVALYPVVREHIEKVVWIKMHEFAPDLAAEAANEVLLNIDKFRGDSKFSTWVHAFARNYAYDEIQKRKREVLVDF